MQQHIKIWIGTSLLSKINVSIVFALLLTAVLVSPAHAVSETNLNDALSKGYKNQKHAHSGTEDIVNESLSATDFKRTDAQTVGVLSAGLSNETYVGPITTSNRSPTIYGYIPERCNDVGILVYADTANFTTGEGIFAFFSEAGDVGLVTDDTSQYAGFFSLNLANNNLGLINGKYNIFVSTMCGWSNTYSDPFYEDLYYDSISIIPTSCSAICAPVHRFYNTQNGAHFYTSNESEKRTVLDLSQYRYEGIVNFAKTSQEAGTVPVHRFYHKVNGTHFYTSNQAEASNVNATLSGTYRYEGVSYYAHSQPVISTVSVHRFYKFQQGVHFFTSNQAEASNVNATLSGTYRYEGVSYYNIINQ